MGGVVAASQSVNVETGTYTMEAAFPNPTSLILPGQFARVRALYEVLNESVVVPRQALVELQGLFRVYLVDEQGMVESREVRKGPESENDVVIEAGLQGGERVIVEGLQRVRPGMTVNVRDWSDTLSKQQDG
jgi:membrane fusion protein (multidrug efflux system)